MYKWVIASITLWALLASVTADNRVDIITIAGSGLQAEKRV
ncbi:hypothetical protein [Vibrio taketomensis]|nr:hypothetical protein [Vibrio taketomensis]